MKKDSRKGLTFNYNSLNLVQNVKDMSGAVKAKYVYTADGSKHSVKDAAEANGYDYTGSLIYSTNNGVRTLESASFEGGVIKGNGEVNYFVTDHLGSIRVIVNASNGQTIERNDYTAFGVRHPNPNLVTSTNRFKFNGKEDQTTGSLALLDYGARMYDPVTGKLNRMDRFAEKYYSISPYAYCAGNPIKNIEINGDSVRVYTETSLPGGHAWISVGEGADMVVYSYGRYNGTNKGPDGSFNSLANGPGVLLKLNGEDAKNFNEKIAS